MISGNPDCIDEFKSWITAYKNLENLDFKESVSGYQPFNRMLVKRKSEIIPFGVEGINPTNSTAPYISPVQLKQWLDDDKDLVLLDTRNRYETRLGSFKQAVKLSMDVFRAFPYVVKKLDTIDRSKPLVTFCTGGIRCEKASALLMEYGFSDVFQLKGGILNYFQECGNSHYEGECFVYDQRVALDSNLRETETVQCYNCSQPVTKKEQQSPSYNVDISCPHCVNGKPVKSQPHTQRSSA